jgi:hypothetical protein
MPFNSRDEGLNFKVHVDDVAGNIWQPLPQDAGAEHRVQVGRAVRLDPMKPKLKPHESKHLKLKCDVLLSSFAFKSNLGRYNLGVGVYAATTLANSFKK